MVTIDLLALRAALPHFGVLTIIDPDNRDYNIRTVSAYDETVREDTIPMAAGMQAIDQMIHEHFASLPEHDDQQVLILSNFSRIEAMRLRALCPVNRICTIGFLRCGGSVVLLTDL